MLDRVLLCSPGWPGTHCDFPARSTEPSSYTEYLKYISICHCICNQGVQLRHFISKQAYGTQALGLQNGSRTWGSSSRKASGTPHLQHQDLEHPAEASWPFSHRGAHTAQTSRQHTESERHSPLPTKMLQPGLGASAQAAFESPTHARTLNGPCSPRACAQGSRGLESTCAPTA